MSAIQIIYAVMLGYFLALNLYYLVFLIMGWSQNCLRRRQERLTDYKLIEESEITLPITIILPAYNEEAVVSESVTSIMASKHPEFELIVINDGSTDRTLKILREDFDLEVYKSFPPSPIPTQPIRNVYSSKLYPNLWVIDKENGGKADACNAGVNQARFRYIIMTDGDCVFFEPETLIRTVRLANFDPKTTI